MIYEQVNTEDIDGFRVVLSFAPEDMHPRDLFDDAIEDLEDICDKIDKGLLLWFVARVEAYKHDVLLGSDYLGGCLYESVRDFIEGGYYIDMVSNVTSEAKQMIAKLSS
jgi:hypothetical protein